MRLSKQSSKSVLLTACPLSFRPRARPRHPTRRSYRSGGGGWRSARIDVRRAFPGRKEGRKERREKQQGQPTRRTAIESAVAQPHELAISSEIMSPPLVCICTYVCIPQGTACSSVLPHVLNLFLKEKAGSHEDMSIGHASTFSHEESYFSRFFSSYIKPYFSAKPSYLSSSSFFSISNYGDMY